MVLFISQLASQSTATRIEHFGVWAHPSEQTLFSPHPCQSLLVAVAMYQRFALECRRAIADTLQEITQQKALLTEALGIFITRHQIRHLILKYRRAAGLQKHHWRAHCDLGSQSHENFPCASLCLFEKAIVVKRTSTTKVVSGHSTTEGKSCLVRLLCRLCP